MASNPLITFKAGSCEIDQSTKPYKVVPNPSSGYVYLYMEENLIHFCWRERSKPLDHEDNLDLVMLPTDCHFLPYESSTSEPNTKTNGRIFILKFSSSFQRYAFWMQSKPEIPTNPSHFSERDLRIGRLVDRLLQGQDVNIPVEIAAIKSSGGNNDDDDEDDPMEDVEGHSSFPIHRDGASGGAGPGGDIRREGASSREGGADGGRADDYGSTDTASIVQNFLNSLKGEQNIATHQTKGALTISIHNLLQSSITIPMIDSFNPVQIDKLLSHLPLTILLIAQELDETREIFDTEIDETDDARLLVALKALSFDCKKSILKRVIRSPQFKQSLWSLTTAIQKGGLPNIAEALQIKVLNSGFVEKETVPLAGGAAIEAFLAGIKTTIIDS
ncbi:putative 26s proteasome complex ubiquitin receptor subunit rpn13 protein [Erysiphe neolycopersici]|uniref:Putative 26s proteasome complex ubiquitin receptor subunit rpn13 protein n=1 Tax=Erysiphe neolycopersici TaxID=212602 RepID=A0A420HEI3_9PEZI|nr:putative 26s proteasome complex ubiquitin receptor subunit rpn13 protein [Erysiphe neolycopersici]